MILVYYNVPKVIKMYGQLACCVNLFKAVRTSMFGRPGACYVDISGDMINAKVERKDVRLVFTFSLQKLQNSFNIDVAALSQILRNGPIHRFYLVYNSIKKLYGCDLVSSE